MYQMNDLFSAVDEELGCYNYNMSLGNDTLLELPETEKLGTCMSHCSDLGYLYVAIQVRRTN
jgi:hypothetical protein